MSFGSGAKIHSGTCTAESANWKHPTDNKKHKLSKHENESFSEQTTRNIIIHSDRIPSTLSFFPCHALQIWEAKRTWYKVFLEQSLYLFCVFSIPLIIIFLSDVFISKKCFFFVFSFCTFSFFSSLSEEESGFLGVLQGRQSVWAGDGDVASRHSISVGHQTRPYVRCIGGTEEATVLQLKNKAVSG